ncbi:hypothetical protein quinque_008366 [Culex quinquefasciatus]
MMIILNPEQLDFWVNSSVLRPGQSESFNTRCLYSFCSFPAEILEAIFAYLPLKDLLNASQVCHRWNKVLQSPLFQRQLQVKLHSEFRDLPSKADEAFLSRAKNLSIVQKFNEDEPEGENGQAGPAEAKENISGILFGACNELECLQL